MIFNCLMRKFVIVFYLVLISFVTFSQNVTENPYVESQFPSKKEGGIVSVYIDQEITAVLWNYITPRNYEGWISLSSKTTLISKVNNLRLKIVSWAVFDGEDINYLNFDEQYSVKADTRYKLVMFFDQIPIGTEIISISENCGGNCFYWNNIHINNSKPIISDNTRKALTPPTYNSQNLGANEFELLGSGTCFALSTNGYLATAYHVIEDANNVRIRGINGDFSKTYKADVVAVDKNNDLALLKINDVDFSSIQGIPYMISDKIADVGESVTVLGYPLRAYMGDEIKLTNGLVSSKTGYQGDVTTYQVSATVQPGNSGGPLFDKSGNVIGVVNSRLNVESASYAIKTPYLKTLIVSSGKSVSLPTTNLLMGKSLAEQVKLIKKFVYIIEIGE